MNNEEMKLWEMPEIDHPSHDEDRDYGLSFSDKDQADLVKLETRMSGGLETVFRALDEIRRRQLWKCLVDANGERVYQTFDAYCTERLGHTRQWVSQGTNWVRIRDLAKKLGIKEQFTRGAVEKFNNRMNDIEGGVKVVLEEVIGDGLALTAKNIDACIERLSKWGRWAKGAPGKVKAATYADFKADLATIQPILDVWASLPYEQQMYESHIEDAIKDEPNPIEALVKVCVANNRLPESSVILYFTGDDLKAIVEGVQPVLAGVQKLELLKKTLQEKVTAITLAAQKEENKEFLKLSAEKETLEAEIKELTPKKTTKKKEEPKTKDHGDEKEPDKDALIWSVFSHDKADDKSQWKRHVMQDPTTQENLNVFSRSYAMTLAQELAGDEFDLEWEQDEEDYSLCAEDDKTFYHVRPNAEIEGPPSLALHDPDAEDEGEEDTGDIDSVDPEMAALHEKIEKLYRDKALKSAVAKVKPNKDKDVATVMVGGVIRQVTKDKPLIVVLDV